MERVRWTTFLLSLLATIGLLSACGDAEPTPPLGAHSLVNALNGDVLATYDQYEGAYKLKDGRKLEPSLIRSLLEGKVRVVYLPDELANRGLPVNGPAEPFVKKEKIVVPLGPCYGGETDCDGLCVDLQTNTKNCGACGIRCAGACRDGMCLP
jgi:hypothetical protein